MTNEWAKYVNNIENVYMDEKRNKLMVVINFNSDKKMSVDAKTVHQKCPVVLLEYYEKNISFTDE